MKEKIFTFFIFFIILIATIVFWEEYSFKKTIQKKIFEECMARVAGDQDYIMLKEVNVPRCLEVSKQ